MISVRRMQVICSGVSLCRLVHVYLNVKWTYRTSDIQGHRRWTCNEEIKQAHNFVIIFQIMTEPCQNPAKSIVRQYITSAIRKGNVRLMYHLSDNYDVTYLSRNARNGGSAISNNAFIKFKSLVIGSKVSNIASVLKGGYSSQR